jgi:2-dehydro-3-deoxyphosphogluconate aldolase/(4S)-4-hydroxy-2-oxoglutarate aldolase
MRLSPVIPVVTLDDAGTAADVAEALLRGGVGVIEVTLRTPQALRCITRIAESVPQMVVGAGTVLGARDVDASIDAGARFLVSPGSPAALVEAMSASGLPFLPGAATVTEMMVLVERGIHEMKFFPAATSGGAAFLEAISAPIPSIAFCPTGGITERNALDYLKIPAVECVGGSWLVTTSDIVHRDWDAITQRARATRRLVLR